MKTKFSIFVLAILVFVVGCGGDNSSPLTRKTQPAPETPVAPALLTLDELNVRLAQLTEVPEDAHFQSSLQALLDNGHKLVRALKDVPSSDGSLEKDRLHVLTPENLIKLRAANSIPGAEIGCLSLNNCYFVVVL